MDLSLPADPWQQTKFEEKRKQQSKSLNPISLDEFKQSVEQDLSLKQEDFHKRLDEADQLRRYGPAIEDTNELPYLVRKMPPPQPPKPEVLTAPPRKRTEEEYLRSHISMLENSVKSLRREKNVWIEKYKHEARNKGILMDLKDGMQEALQRQQFAEKRADDCEEQINSDRQLIRRLRLQIVDLKKSVHKREMTAVKSEELNDLLYKPKLETLHEEHETLEDEHFVLKEHFESLYRELSKFQSGARLKERKKRMQQALEESFKKKKKGGRGAKKKGKKKKRKKNEPLKVWEQIEETLEKRLEQRKTQVKIQLDAFTEHGNSPNAVDDEQNIELTNERVRVNPVISSAIVLPLRQYSISNDLPKEMSSKIPEVSINTLYSILAKASTKYVNRLNTTKDTIDCSVTFATTLIEVLIDIYEVWPVIQMYIYGVVETIKSLSEGEKGNVRVAFFGRLLGVVNPELYCERACSTFLPILSRISNGNIEYALNGSLIYDHAENSNPSTSYFFPMKEAKQICERTFKNLDVKYERFTLALKPEIYEQLENNLLQYSCVGVGHKEAGKSGESEREIDLDTFLAITMNAWYEQAQYDMYRLSTFVWKKFGCTDPQVFDLPLLREILEEQIPKGFTSEELVFVYKQLMSCQIMSNDVGNGLNVGDGLVDREVFAVVLHTYGITPFKSELSEEELLEIEKKKEKERKDREKRNKKKRK